MKPVTKKANEQAAKLKATFGEDGDQYTLTHGKDTLRGLSPDRMVMNMEALIDLRTNYKSFKVTLDPANSTISLKCDKPKIELHDMNPVVALTKAKEVWKEYRASLEEETPEEEAAEEADKEVRSVVDERFRTRYKEQGHPTHCGDWLAVTLINLTTNKQGINTALFEEICQANGVDTAKYSHTSPGWQGRLRMTGRNLLAKVVHRTGILKLPEHLGEDLKVPADWASEQRYGKGAEQAPVLIPEKVPVAAPKPTVAVRNPQVAAAKRARLVAKSTSRVR